MPVVPVQSVLAGWRGAHEGLTPWHIAKRGRQWHVEFERSRVDHITIVGLQADSSTHGEFGSRKFVDLIGAAGVHGVGSVAGGDCRHSEPIWNLELPVNSTGAEAKNQTHANPRNYIRLD